MKFRLHHALNFIVLMTNTYQSFGEKWLHFIMQHVPQPINWTAAPIRSNINITMEFVTSHPDIQWSLPNFYIFPFKEDQNDFNGTSMEIIT